MAKDIRIEIKQKLFLVATTYQQIPTMHISNLGQMDI